MRGEGAWVGLGAREGGGGDGDEGEARGGGAREAGRRRLPVEGRLSSKALYGGVAGG